MGISNFPTMYRDFWRDLKELWDKMWSLWHKRLARQQRKLDDATIPAWMLGACLQTIIEDTEHEGTPHAYHVGTVDGLHDGAVAHDKTGFWTKGRFYVLPVDPE